MDRKMIVDVLWRDGYHAAAKYIETLEERNSELTRYYLELCDHYCAGDPSVGVPACPFFECPDVDCAGGCQLKGELRVDES